METVLIGVCSGIAAFKVVSLVKSLKQKGFEVIVIMTENAKRMIKPEEFEKASENKVASELFPKGFDYKKILKSRKVEHINLADKAKVIAIVPATANVIGKIANGIADDLLSTTVLASKAKLIICPSMNVNMWNNELTCKNTAKLREIGAVIVEPCEGKLACGYKGKGRLVDIKIIEEEIVKSVNKSRELQGKKIVVTAGGTEEPIDEVRVITNKSSGKMGIRIAEECVKRGGEVTLIRGRTDVEPTVRMNEKKIRTAKEMTNEIDKIILRTDIFIQAAAVSDFTIEKKKGKISSSKKISLLLTPNVKILDKIRVKNKKIFLVGFKAEHNVTEKNLQEKALITLKKSQADLIIANDISRNDFGSDKNEVLIVDSQHVKKIKRADKRIIAGKIVDEVVRRSKM